MPDSAQLVDALESNLWSMWGALGNCPGGRITDSPTRLLVETPLPQAPYNSVFRFLDDGTRGLQEQVDDVLTLYESRPVTLVWVVHPTSPPAVRDCLAARGLVMAEEISGMVVELAGLDLDVAPAPGVEIVEATAAHSAEWMELATVRFGLDDAGAGMVKQLIEDNIDHADFFLAKVGGVPLSKAVLHITGDLAGIYAVATAEEGRGKGLAKALTKHALATARDSGCHLGLLHSTPMAREMYRSLGFRDVAMFELWAEPDRVYL